MLTTNSTSSEKLKPLVIGKSNKPHCFKKVKDRSALPVTYKNNASAWMKQDIFEEWLKDLDYKFRVEDRRVLLLIDNATSHGIADSDNEERSQTDNCISYLT